VTDPVAPILASEKDIVIKAGAGAGKTYTLVKRYLAELIREREGAFARVENLAAITFTEKAAEEMRERLRAALTEEIEARLTRWWEAKGGSVADRPSAANLDEFIHPKGAEEAVLLHLVRQRQSLSGAYISTIHSFCARLLQENPIGAGVDPGFTVADGGRAALLLEEAAHDEVLDRLRKRERGTIRLVMALGFAGGVSAAGLTGTVARLIPLLRAAHAPVKQLAADYEARLATLLAEREEAVPELAPFLPQLEVGGAKSKERSTYALLLEAPGLLAGRPSVADAAAAMEAADALLKAVKNRKTADDDDIARAVRLKELVDRVAGPTVEEAVAPDTLALLELVNATRRRYEAAKREQGQLDFDDLEERALALLERHPDTLAAYRKKFHRVMVDEFQDTNELQRKIVATLAPPGENRLLVVGDVKQSIYGFRGADVTVFARTAEVVASVGGDIFPLAVNRRSVPALLDFTNGFFAPLMTGAATPGAYAFDPAVDRLTPFRPAPPGEDHPVERFVVTGGERAGDRRFAEALGLAARIKAGVGGQWNVADPESGVRRPARFGDVGILLRVFSNVALYESALRFAGVPFTVVKGRGFFETTEIADLVGLLTFLDYAGDRLALFATLRSPLVGLSDGGLLRLARDGAGKKRSPEGGLLDPPDDLAPDDADRLALFARRAATWRNLKDRLTVSELIEKILADTGYAAVTLGRIHGEQRLANLFKLIERARKGEADPRFGLRPFLEECRRAADDGREAQAEAGGEENTVKVMTVHQSKGLEFPIVAVADLGGKPSSDHTPAAYHPHGGFGVKLYDETTGGWIKPPVYAKVAEALKTFAVEESKRLLYVAMTRARDRLILSGPAEGQGEWRRWIDEVAEGQGLTMTIVDAAAYPPVIEETGDETPEQVRMIIEEGWKPDATPAVASPPAPRPDLRLPVTGLATFMVCPRLYYYRNVMRLPGEGPGHGGDGTRTGVAGHALLERIAPATATDPVALGGRVAVAFPEESAAFRNKLVKDIGRAFASPPLTDLPRADALYTEAPLTIRLTDERISLTLTGAVDLLFHVDGEWRIVDYKFSRRPEDETGYRRQLGLYAVGWGMVAAADRLTGGVVYIRESRTPATIWTIGPDDLASVRADALSAGGRLAAMDGRPADDWRLPVGADCPDPACRYKRRCDDARRG
jgi:ATP-dependent helicase/nuclease subunit A